MSMTTGFAMMPGLFKRKSSNRKSRKKSGSGDYSIDFLR